MFTIRSDRTFAIYTLSVESKALSLIYSHGSKAIDQLTRVQVNPTTGEIGLLFAHNFVEVVNLPPGFQESVNEVEDVGETTTVQC